MLKRLGKSWLPLLVLVAVAIGVFVVFRLHGVFGSDNEITREGSGIANDAAPFNPKRVIYEVFGPAGAVATINYLDLSTESPKRQRCAASLVAHADHHIAGEQSDPACSGQRGNDRLSNHRRRHSQRREVHRRRRCFHLLPGEIGMTRNDADMAGGRRPIIPRFIRTFAAPLLFGWVALAALLTVAVPSLEDVGKEHSVSLSPNDAPSMQAMKHIGHVFKESDSDASAMIVFEGDQPLGDEAHRYYADLIRQLKADTAHITHVQDYWGDPLTAAGAQSGDGKATYVQLNLAGNQGEARANESIAAVRGIIARTPPPAGIHVYVTGGTALIADQHNVGDKSLKLVTALTLLVILLSLFIVYRSMTTVVLVLVMVILEVVAARGVVAALGHYDLIGLSTFSVNLLTMLGIASGTDYAIFVLGRYHEARNAGEDRQTAFYTMYRGTAHVILGSGLTIAGATYCLHFTRLPYFQTLGVPLAIGIAVAVLASLTMAPAMLVIGGRFGLFEPKRAARTRGWRRVGTAVVRWPGPILGRGLHAGSGWAARAARLQDQLQRPQVHAAQYSRDARVRRRRPAFLPSPDESGSSHGSNRPGSAQFRGHVDHRTHRTQRLSHPRHRARADHQPAAGYPD